jgi:hypothetical protein
MAGSPTCMFYFVTLSLLSHAGPLLGVSLDPTTPTTRPGPGPSVRLLIPCPVGGDLVLLQGATQTDDLLAYRHTSAKQQSAAARGISRPQRQRDKRSPLRRAGAPQHCCARGSSSAEPTRTCPSLGRAWKGTSGPRIAARTGQPSARMAPRRKKQPHPPRVARHQAPPSPTKPRPRQPGCGARCGIATMIALATVAQLSHLPMLSNRTPTQQSGLFTRIWSSAQQRAGHYGLSSEVTVAQRACGKCDATTLHIAIRSDLTRDGAERRDGARRTWLRWLKGLEGVSYEFFVVDSDSYNRTGLQNDLVKEYELHKDIGVEVLSQGDELSAELKIISRILKERNQLSHILATNDRSLLCVHRIREEIKKRPLFQFAWTKFKCVAPADELPPLQLAEGFLLLTRDVAELLAKLSDNGRRSLDVAALLPLLSVTTLDDQTRLASPSTTSEHIQMLYDQTKSRAFRPKQMHFCQKHVAALDVGSRKWYPATPKPTFMPTPRPSRRPSPRPTRPPRRFFDQAPPEVDEPVSERPPPERRRRRRRWLPRLWTGRRLKAAGFFELVRPHEDDELGDTAIAQHDDDAPREPKLAPENDDDDTSGKEAEAWLDQGKVPEGDWLDAGVEADVSGDESDDDQGRRLGLREAVTEAARRSATTEAARY